MIWAELIIMIAIAFVAGAVPFSNLVSQKLTKTDLRHLDSGTVSGSGLYKVAGFLPLAVGGLLDVGKGVLGPLLANQLWTQDRWLWVALVGTAAIVGHNWSVFLGGAGGRGIATALGAFAVIAWPACLYLLGGLALGRLLRHTGLAVFCTLTTLPLFLIAASNTKASIAAAIIVSPMFIKRIAGNHPLPAHNRIKATTHRLVFDNDNWANS